MLEQFGAIVCKKKYGGVFSVSSCSAVSKARPALIIIIETRSRTAKQPSLFVDAVRTVADWGPGPTNGLARRGTPGYPTKSQSRKTGWISTCGGSKSGRHPHLTCMLSAKDKLEFSYRTLNSGILVKIIIEFHGITSKKKNQVGYFSR